jgi:hypothetical protein
LEWRFLTDGPWIAEQIAGLNRILSLGFAVEFLCAQDFSAGESARTVNVRWPLFFL